MKNILEETKLPVAYDHFSKKDNIQPPYILYKEENTDNFMADDKVYNKIQNYSIWLITKKKDKTSELLLENVLDSHNIPYDKVNEDYIREENIFQVNYEI